MINLLLEILNWQAASKGNKQEEILQCLELKEGSVVADIGSGGGSYTYRFSQAVGKHGKVYAIDVDQRYLDFVRTKAAAKGLSNVTTLLTKGSELVLPRKSVDLVFMRDVFHDISRPQQYFSNIHRALKAGGRVAIIDFLNDGISKESITGHCTDERVILEAMQNCEFEHYRSFNFLRKQSFNIFIS